MSGSALLLGVDVTPAAGGGGQSAHSLSFDGTGAVTLNSVINLGTTHTISLWTKKTGTTEEILISDSGSGYVPDIDATTIYYNAQNASLVSVAHGGADGSWIHWAIVRSGTSVSFYKNGSQIGTTQTLGASAGLNVTVFGERNNASFHYTGLMDDVAFFTSALSGATIAGIAAGTTDVATLSPIGLWRFEEGSGTTAADTSGGGDTGTLSGGVTWSTDVPTQLA